MKRQLALAAVFAVVLVPDWVSACWPSAPVAAYQPVYYYPSYGHCPPPVYYPCPPVYVVPCPPAAAPRLQPPRVEPPKPVSAADGPKPVADQTPGPRAPKVEPVRPAANVEAPRAKEPAPVAPKVEVRPDPPKVEAAPSPAPVPPKVEKAPEPKLEFRAPKADAPPVEPKLPPLTLPGEGKEPKRPLGAPALPGGDPKLPPLELPKDGEPKLPALELPTGDGAPAVPVPAPAPDALIPPPGVSVPGAGLPSLTLPPDSPVAPDLKPVEAKSSPLAGAGEPKVSVFAADGPALAGGLRKVGFYNHTGRPLALTIDGKAVTLPAKSYLHAHLPPTFTWRHADRAPAREAVPADAGGLDVVFRE